MTEEKKKPRPKVRKSAANSKTEYGTADNVSDTDTRSKPKPKPKQLINVSDLRIRYCTSTEDGPTSPLLDQHNARYSEFMELWQPGKKWDKSQDGGYMAKGERKLPAVPVSAKNNNGYIVPFSKESMRKDSAMQSQQVYLLDYDKMPIGTLDAVQQALNGLGIWHVTYTTASHLTAKKDGLECFRVGFVTDKPADNTYDMVLMRVAFDDLLCRLVPALEVDPASFAVSQPMYLPAHGSAVTVSGETAVSVTKLRAHFALHKLSVHRTSAVKKDAVVPDYISDLFQPLAQMLVDLGATTGRDGRMYLPATDEHAEQYSTETKPDDFSFMFPCDGVADQFNVGFIHGTDLDYRDSIKFKAKESPAKYAERRRMECIRYACAAVTEEGPDRDRLLTVVTETLRTAREAWTASKEAELHAELGDDEEEAAKGKALAVIEKGKQRVKAWTEADDAAVAFAEEVAVAKGNDAISTMNLAAKMMHGPLSPYVIGYDRFMQRAVYKHPKSKRGWRPMEDHVLVRLWMWYNEQDPEYQMNRGDIAAVADVVAHENSFDSAQDIARTLEWDGVERVPGFFHDHFGVECSEYTTAASVAFWMGAAGRLKYPGIKYDLTPILTGAQGIGKTSTVRALCFDPQYFGTMSPKAKEKARRMKGKMIMELAELESLRNMEDIGELKSFLSEQADEDRAAYGKYHQQLPRRCVFIATSNPKDILRDDTGERRWLPMEATQCNVEHTASLRDQLWAEALVKCNRDTVRESSMLAERLARDVVAQFKQEDPLAEVVQEVMEELFDEDGLSQPATSTNIMQAVMERVRAGAVGTLRVDSRKLAATLRALGYYRTGKLDKEWRKSQ